MHLTPLPAFNDNYLWLWHTNTHAVVVDPGDGAVVLQALQRAQLQLQAILVTHHHADHTGGVDMLRAATQAVVYGPAGESIPGPYVPVSGGDAFDWQGQRIEVIDVPGHTAGHIAYFVPTADTAPLLFCGDTLFSGGCGRLFEGTAAQMLASLDRLAALPGNTQVCCAHEYTLSNLRFALAVEPRNADLLAYHARCQHLRAQGQPTLPSSMAQELAINPFMRSRQADVVQAVMQRSPQALDEVAVFAQLREWKNQF
jgi:hydroxyacylglutathione hydrolase